MYLRPVDLQGELRQTLKERPSEWSTWLLQAFSRSRWARARQLSGQEALFGFYAAWEGIAVELCGLHRGPLCVVEGAHGDWDAALRRIFDAVRPGDAGSTRA